MSGGGIGATTLSWPVAGAGTISLWVNESSYSAWTSPAGWKTNPSVSSNGYALIDEGGAGSPGTWRAVFRPNNGGAAEINVSASTNIQMNTWQFVVMTWSLSGTVYTIHLYVNGADQGYATWSGTPGALGGFHFGNAGDYNFNNFFGLIANVRVYERALDTSEIHSLYLAEAPRHGIAFAGRADGYPF